MAEIRAGRGWSDDEIHANLEHAWTLDRSCPDKPLGEMLVRDGWRAERSEARIAWEAPGPPVPDGAFERAREALTRLAFSDPTIVEIHFDPAAPLQGRRMLLELKVLGLHYLCAVEVVDVRDEQTDEASTFGFRYDTLEGHIERGAEWFLVTKDHATGTISLCITSRWRRGDMPNAWTRTGFTVLAPYYRRLWLHRAHERLRALLAQPPAQLAVAAEGLGDEGPPIERIPPLPERAHARPGETLAFAAALGALTGVRSLSALATLAVRTVVAGPQPGARRVERALARPGAAVVFSALELGEMAGDKTPWLPARISPLSVAGRLGLGALAGAIHAMRWRNPPRRSALVAALAAGASTFAAYHLREGASRRFGIPTALLGLVEDALVVAAAAGLFVGLTRAEPPAYTLGHTVLAVAGHSGVIERLSNTHSVSQPSNAK